MIQIPVPLLEMIGFSHGVFFRNFLQHRVNESFCMFSREQLVGIDFLNHVKPRMVVAFTSDLGFKGLYRSNVYSSGFLHFAEVEHIDTFRRVFVAKSLVNGEVLTANLHQVVGMEDVAKRKCFLSYHPAPDSATELESLSHTAAVGHLILALRWCASVQSSSAAVVRLAALLSAFLGAELSIHSIIGSTLNKQKEEVERVEAQVLDLYGDAPEGRTGLLRTVLNVSTWAAIRQQLDRELRSAAEAESSRHATSDMVIDDGIFARSRAPNPYSSLRMDYT